MLLLLKVLSTQSLIITDCFLLCFSLRSVITPLKKRIRYHSVVPETLERQGIYHFRPLFKLVQYVLNNTGECSITCCFPTRKEETGNISSIPKNGKWAQNYGYSPHILSDLEDLSKTCSAIFVFKGRDCISNHNLAGYTIYITSIPMATLQQTWMSISSSMSQEFTDYEKNPF